MLTNVGAANLLDPQDQALLWDQASEAFGESASVVRRFELSSGERIQARCTPIRIGAIVAGVLIEVGPAPLAAQQPQRTAAQAQQSEYSSPAWTELERQLDAPAVRSAMRIRIIGEASTGKLGVAARIHDARHPSEPHTVHPAALTLAHGTQSWLTSVIARLKDPRGTVVIKNIDQLALNVGNALVELLDAARDPLPLLIATSTSSTQAYSVLEDRFGGPVLRVPPLRDRRADIPNLAHEAIRRTGSAARRVGNQACAALCSYGWPGNFRQLNTVMSEAVRAAGASDVGLEHLPDDISADVPRGRRRTLSGMERMERDAILAALREQQGNKSRAAAALGLSRSTMYRKLRLFGLDADRALL
jgi:DNA-binding NtrC family response regulator